MFTWFIDLYSNLLVPKLRDLVLSGVIHEQTNFWTYLDIGEQIFNFFFEILIVISVIILDYS